MSRSYKKNKVLKYCRTLLSHEYNRIFRRVNKQRVKEFKEPLLMCELINPYDVYDNIWRARTKEEEKSKYFRK